MATTILELREGAEHLLEHIADLKEGDKIILCEEKRPIAEIVPLPKVSSEPRPLGLGAGLARVPDSFFDPLPDDLLDSFERK